jgi:UDP-N-acetylglucosamine acyltransferase
MTNQHPTAIVSPKAKLGENVTLAPFSIINDDVEIGDNTYIGPHAVVYDGARIGSGVKIYQGASIAHVPQDLKFGKERTFLYVGDDTTIHEHVTLHRGTMETGESRIGKNVLLMAYSHVAHDCQVGDNCILANGVQLAGHVHVDDWAILGGLVAVHQFTRVGKHVMVGGGYRVVKDVPPYILVAGEPVRFGGVNFVGLRRRGFSNEQINSIKRAYTIIFSPKYNVSQSLAVLQEQPLDEIVLGIIEFIKDSKRGIVGK